MKKILFNKNVNRHAFTFLELLYFYRMHACFDELTCSKIQDLISFIERKFNLDYSILNSDVEEELLQLFVFCKSDI